MEVREYGPSDYEDSWGNWPPRTCVCHVSEALFDLHPPPLKCTLCDVITPRLLHRTGCGLLTWQVVCPVCASAAPG